MMDNLSQTNGVKDEELQRNPQRGFRLKKGWLSRGGAYGRRMQKKDDKRYCSTGGRKFTPWVFIWSFLAGVCMARVFMLDSALTPAR